MNRLMVAVFLVACEEPTTPPQGPAQWTYQNGYAQPTTQAPVTYTPLAATAQTAQTAAPPVYTTQNGPETPTPPLTTAQQIQTTPVPLGVQTLPPPTPTTTAMTPQTTMSVPGRGAFVCTSDAQCLLGRCNTSYGKCAYPCKNSEKDCKAGNVCTATGLCMPKGAAGVAM